MSYTKRLRTEKLRDVEHERECEGSPTPFPEQTGLPNHDCRHDGADRERREASAEHDGARSVPDVVGQGDQDDAVLPERFLTDCVQAEGLASVVRERQTRPDQANYEGRE